MLNRLKDKQLILAGDGHCDSPGKCAKYCTYSLVEQGDDLIVHMETMDKRLVSLKSPNMKREALCRAMLFLSSRVKIA